MTDQGVRREELIAAALAGELSVGERERLEQLRAEDPTVQDELDEMEDIVTRLRTTVPDWSDEEPPSRLKAAVQAIGLAETETGTGSGTQRPEDVPALDHHDVRTDRALRRHGDTHRGPRRGRRERRPAGMIAAAAGFFVVGVGVTLGVQTVQDAPPQGPPGTYGAVETVDFTTGTDDAVIEAALIAHTWGTETVLEVDGLAPGESFTVVLIAENGDEVHSGAFIGSEVLIECRLNADVMRDEVSRLEITGPDGDIVVAADLPAAMDPEEAQAQQ